MSEKKLLILNGPGVGDLSDFDGNSYGNITLEQLHQECRSLCDSLDIELDFRQTDDEDEMFRYIAKDSDSYSGLVINPVGYSRAASLDFDIYRMAIKSTAHLKRPVIEVHLTNIFLDDAEVIRPLQPPEGEVGFISGFGANSYLLAIQAIDKRLNA